MLLALLLAATITPDPFDYQIIGGASISNVESTHQTKPFVDLGADFSPAGFAKLRIGAEAVYAGSVGQSSVNIEDLKTFDSGTFNAGIAYEIGRNDTGRTRVGISGGVTTRFTNQAADKNPGHGELCIGFYSVSHDKQLSICPVGFSSETQDPSTVARFDARLTIADAIRLQVSVIVPYGNAPSNAYQTGQVHNVISQVAIGADLDHIFNRDKAKQVTTNYKVPTVEIHRNVVS